MARQTIWVVLDEADDIVYVYHRAPKAGQVRYLFDDCSSCSDGKCRYCNAVDSSSDGVNECEGAAKHRAVFLDAEGYNSSACQTEFEETSELKLKGGRIYKIEMNCTSDLIPKPKVDKKKTTKKKVAKKKGTFV